MAKAAYCSECGENVYLTADGTCPKGHGTEALSNEYDAPEPPPADQGPIEEPVAVPASRHRSAHDLEVQAPPHHRHRGRRVAAVRLRLARRWRLVPR